MKSKQEYISLIGPMHVECDMCKKYKRMNFYKKYPHPAVFNIMPKEMQKAITICRDCANREAGTKKKNTFHRGIVTTKNRFE